MDKLKNPVVLSECTFSIEERHRIIKEYLSGNYTKAEIWRKYTGQLEEHGRLTRWMRQLGYLSKDKLIKRKKFVTLKPQIFLPLDTKKELNPEELIKRIKELEKQLETSQLKVEGYELMIDIAEKDLRIPIRKKSDTK